MDLQTEVVIDAPAHAAWAVFGECWGHIGHWATPVTASFLDGEPCPGAVRTCHTARFGPVAPGLVRERLLSFDAESMSFAYEAIEGMPKFIERAVNRCSIHTIDEHRCMVRSHATLQLRGVMSLFEFLLRRNFKANAARVFDELRHRIEHGSPHPRKVAAVLKEPIRPGVVAHGAGVC